MDAGSQPVISFQVVETLLGTTEDPGAEVGPEAVAMNGSLELAVFDPECMPGLSEATKVFMETKEAKYWLHRFMEGIASEEMICSRFGVEVLEFFQMWLAIRDDMDTQVRNCADAVRHVADTVCEEGGDESDATTVAAGVEGKAGMTAAKKGYVAPDAARKAEEDSDSDEEEGEQDCQECEGAEVDGGETEAVHGVALPVAAGASALAIGGPGPDGSLSDGFGTLPGNAADSADAEMSSAVAAAAESTTEHHATSSTDGKKQTDLKGWLK